MLKRGGRVHGGLPRAALPRLTPGSATKSPEPVRAPKYGWQGGGGGQVVLDSQGAELRVGECGGGRAWGGGGKVLAFREGKEVRREERAIQTVAHWTPVAGDGSLWPGRKLYWQGRGEPTRLPCKPSSLGGGQELASPTAPLAHQGSLAGKRPAACLGPGRGGGGLLLALGVSCKAGWGQKRRALGEKRDSGAAEGPYGLLPPPCGQWRS